jgi:hypothetical protein
LPSVGAKTALSFLRFATIQGVEREEGLADLTPQVRFVSGEAVEREAWQIRETQKAIRELSGRKDGSF